MNGRPRPAHPGRRRLQRRPACRRRPRAHRPGAAAPPRHHRPDRRPGLVEASGVRLVDRTREDGEAVATEGAGPARPAFRAVDFDEGAATAEITVSHTSAGPAAVALHIAGAASRIPVPATGDRYTWTTVRAELTAPAEGVHDLRVVLRGELRLAAISFDRAAPRPRPVGPIDSRPAPPRSSG
ncbi:carbohydrate-binding protein [Kitasatospora sp. NPDC085879]|uniref:carbohydrate-binding protein n=1 Tax=Kitasatospora sp. NPDC085879 TaxID=3154769 RepID=UPI00343F1DB1